MKEDGPFLSIKKLHREHMPEIGYYKYYAQERHIKRREDNRKHKSYKTFSKKIKVINS